LGGAGKLRRLKKPSYWEGFGADGSAQEAEKIELIFRQSLRDQSLVIMQDAKGYRGEKGIKRDFLDRRKKRMTRLLIYDSKLLAYLFLSKFPEGSADKALISSPVLRARKRPCE